MPLRYRFELRKLFRRVFTIYFIQTRSLGCLFLLSLFAHVPAYSQSLGGNKVSREFALKLMDAISDKTCEEFTKNLSEGNHTKANKFEIRREIADMLDAKFKKYNYNVTYAFVSDYSDLIMRDIARKCPEIF
jgi:hypothetical protein